MAHRSLELWCPVRLTAEYKRGASALEPTCLVSGRTVTSRKPQLAGDMTTMESWNNFSILEVKLDEKIWSEDGDDVSQRVCFDDRRWVL
jgi:hypothetical protein